MRRLLLILTAVLAAGCSSLGPQPVGPDALLSADTVGNAHLVDDLAGWPSDRLDFQRIEIVGDSLVANVTFGGGCAEHTFALVFAGAFMESDPVQVRGLLSHDGHGDRCRALLSRSLRYDLRPLRDAWRAAYRQDSGVIVLHGNWPEPLRYAF